MINPAKYYNPKADPSRGARFLGRVYIWMLREVIKWHWNDPADVENEVLFVVFCFFKHKFFKLYT